MNESKINIKLTDLLRSAIVAYIRQRTGRVGPIALTEVVISDLQDDATIQVKYVVRP